MHRDPQDRTPAYTEPVAQLNTPQSEDEIRSAIASLKASTRATERQTALLNAQNSLADKLNLFPGAQRTQKKGHAWHLAQRENAEVQHVKFANDELTHALNAELQDERDNVAKNIKPVHAIVSETFNSDDRALTDLNDVDVDKPSNTPHFDSLRVQAAKLTAALRHFRQQNLKNRLDRIYLESLDPSTYGDDLGDISDASPVEVQTDLGSLYAEIDDVVNMLVSQEHGDPFDSAFESMERLKDQASRARITQTHDKLLSMTQYLENTATRLENIQEQRLALETLSAEYKKICSERQSSPQSGIHQAESGRAAGTPALLSLLQHLGMSDTAPDQLAGQIEQLGSKYTNQTHSNLEQTVQMSRDAPKSMQSALKDISTALSSSTSRKQEIQTLEEQISSARAQLASIAASAS